ALVFRLAPAIEAKRAGYRNGIVFSNMFNQAQRATADAISSDWDGYREAVDLRLAGSGTMATADIADFFARIYLHRLENGLVALSSDMASTAAIMRLLKAWSGGTSYGIPIGPRISNILAEACLTEVDEYLINIPSSFIRFIDDYTMFGKDEADCLRTLYNLGSRLMLSQGLTLNMAKTRVFDPDQFRRWRLSPRTREDEIKDEIFAKVIGSNPYEFIDYDDLTDEQR